MDWKADVRSRFSPREDSAKWDRMYAEDTESVEDEFFRLRRDFTLDYVTTRYDISAAICDLGCGAGPVISELLRRGYDAVGFDYSADMLGNAARRIATVAAGRRPLARADIQILPLRDASIDCAVCLGVISYVERYENILAEIRRILKPGGTAIVTYRNEKNLVVSDPLGPFRHLAKAMLRAGGRRRPFRIGDHMRYAEVRDALGQGGLAIEHFAGLGFGPPRFNGRPFLGEKSALALHRALTRWTGTSGAGLPFRIGADVHIFVVRKSVEDMAASRET